ncbi:DUF2637 domain-containing protein [Streptomyces sp. NPDC056454]|uniref:DUF2637 domain-containing protein n=1 Tax=Streptomyces sp. NPDC056454 TaxID=3345823 RepID=UPI0036C0C862
MTPALLTKGTRTTPTTPASGQGFSAPARRDWDKTLTDGLIYLLAIGGFYVIFQTLYGLALTVGLPKDQAFVVACLADLAILAYSRKAVQEVNEGRSAWGIRLIVAVLSLSTFTLQVRSAWGDPVAVGFHALPATVWIIGHEMMLRGKLRNAKRQRREREIAQGLRPAPLPRIRAIHWLLSFHRTFQVWRLTKLWEVPQSTVVKQLAQEWRDDPKRKGKPLPAAWRHALTSTPGPSPEPAALDRVVIPAPITPKTAPALPAVQPLRLVAPPAQLNIPGPTLTFKASSPPAPPSLFSSPGMTAAARIALFRDSAPREAVPAETQRQFMLTLPAAPAGGRPKAAARAYIMRVHDLAAAADINCTGRFLAALLQVNETYVSRLKEEIRVMSTAERHLELAAVGS